MLTEKPKAIIVTVRDRKANESKSITVYDATVDDVYKRVKSALNK